MKFLCFVCAVLGVGFVLRAQINPAPLLSATNALPVATPAAQTNSSMEIRPTEIQCSGPFWASTKSNVVIYRDDVRVDNPQMKIRCELLTVEAPKWTKGTYNRGTAETNVVIDWVDDKGLTNHATADKAVYTYIVTNVAEGMAGSHFETNSTVVLSGGNPTFTNDQVTFHGDPINYDRITGVISTTNMQKMVVSPPPKTNSSGFFQTSGLQPSKTNAAAK